MHQGINLPNSSSLKSHQQLLAYAVETLDSTESQTILQDKKLRSSYAVHLVKQVEISLKSSDAALTVANRGLDWIYDNYTFTHGKDTVKLSEIERLQVKPKFKHVTIQGKGKNDENAMALPYQGEKLKGEALTTRLNKWVEVGTIEPSARDAIQQVLKHPGYISDLQDTIFVCLGAASAMAPTQSLLSMGLHVVAIDLDKRPHLWTPLIQHAKKHAGTLTVPVPLNWKSDIASHCGANLLTDTLEIIEWLKNLYPEKKMVVGCYAYLDGVRHVQISVAMDLIASSMVKFGRAKALAYLCTPTDVHVIPEPAKLAAKANYESRTVLATLLRPFLDPNVHPGVTSDNGESFAIVDALMTQQGINYAIAKRIQHWRAMVARQTNQIYVSSNVAPMTNTVSVTHNRLFKWAYAGAHHFSPAEIFEVPASSTIMTLLLIHDLCDPNGAANPKTRLRNPLELFSFSAFNGGVWRNGFKINDVGTVSAVIHLTTLPVSYVSGLVGNVMGGVRAKL